MAEHSLAAPRFRVLGVTDVVTERGPIDLGTPQQRCVLTLLLLECGRMVPMDRLVDAVWPVGPPTTARKAIQVYISHLRRALRDVHGVELHTVRPGYCLDVDAEDVDVHCFRALVGRAKTVPPQAARELLEQALALWRGPAVSDVPSDDMRDSLAAGLEEQRMIAWEERIAMDVWLGRSPRVICELTEFVAAHPLRERGHCLLMRALFSSGRQAEALAAFGNVRTILAERLGTEPGPELRSLHEQLLHGRIDVERDLLPGSVNDEGNEPERTAVVATGLSTDR